ncbi:MAG TPA: hypothetical protein VHZ24_03985 [Pirellulales bacterium]|nr:hypothetical protein [Pirellulales bacterium]
MYAFSELPIWNVREGGADNWAQNITPTSTAGVASGTATVIGAPFSWNAGVRAGLGYQSDDGYDVPVDTVATFPGVSHTYLFTSAYENLIQDLGSLALQGIIGINVRYRGVYGMIGYEINDWLNQSQVFDDATGAHNNDLILQGLNIRLGYGF